MQKNVLKKIFEYLNKIKHIQLLLIVFVLFSCKKNYNKEERLTIKVLENNIKLTENNIYDFYEIINNQILIGDFERKELNEKKLSLFDSVFKLSKHFSISNYGQKNLDSLYRLLDICNSSIKCDINYKKHKFKENNSDSINFLIYKLNFLNQISELKNQIYYSLDAKTSYCFITEYRPYFVDLKTMGFTTDSIYILTTKPYMSKLINHVTISQKGKTISEDTVFSDFYKIKKLKKGKYNLECRGYRYYYLKDSLVKEKNSFSLNYFEFEVK